MQSLVFERNFYLTNVLDNKNFDDVEEFFDFVKQHPQFHYSGITDYQDFSKKYTTDGWLGRKILAIPAGIYHGIVKVIVTLAISLIICIPFFALAVEKGEVFINCKCVLFHSIRQVQISFGYLASLFNDQYGLYHTQEGHFYQTCYECWITQKTFKQAINQNKHVIIFTN